MIDLIIFGIYNRDMATNKRGRGRPQKEAEETKSESVLLRLAPSEKEGFASAASVAGAPLTVWIRERLRTAAALELAAAGRTIPFRD